MDKFLDTCDHPKLNQEDINHLNRSITCSEIEAATKSLPTRKVQDLTDSQTVKEELIPTLLELIHKIEREGTLPYSFYGASITLHLKLDKYTYKKENYRAYTLMNINVNILNIIMANEIQQHIRKIIHHKQVGFI
jgi:hypothetical protein